VKSGAVNPAQRLARHQAQQKTFRRYPAGNFAESGDVPQGDTSLLKFEVAQIFQNDVRHRHAQSGRKILLRHSLLSRRIAQEADQAIGQILGIARLIELNGHAFAVRHLAKILEVGAHNGNAIGAGEMSHAAAAGRRRVRHDRNRRTLEQIRQSILMHVAGEIDVRIVGTLAFHRFHIARSLRVVSASNYEPGVR